MRPLRAAALLVLLCAAELAAAQEIPGPPEHCTEEIRRSTAWGVATAAYQVRMCGWCVWVLNSARLGVGGRR